jgi:hypothetical protein
LPFLIASTGCAKFPRPVLGESNIRHTAVGAPAALRHLVRIQQAEKWARA